jgi:hypothetical protein
MVGTMNHANFAITRLKKLLLAGEPHFFVQDVRGIKENRGGEKDAT